MNALIVACGTLSRTIVIVLAFLSMQHDESCGVGEQTTSKALATNMQVSKLIKSYPSQDMALKNVGVISTFAKANGVSFSPLSKSKRELYKLFPNILPSFVLVFFRFFLFASFSSLVPFLECVWCLCLLQLHRRYKCESCTQSCTTRSSIND